MQTPYTYDGLNIYVQEDVPKMQLSPDVMVPAAFRVEINAWMRKFFGYTNLLPNGQVVISGNYAIMNEHTYKQFLRAMDAWNFRGV